MKWSWMLISRVPTSSLFSLPSMDDRKRLLNHGSEYWYIGSMLPRSVMQKKSTIVYSPHGR